MGPENSDKPLEVGTSRKSQPGFESSLGESASSLGLVENKGQSFTTNARGIKSQEQVYKKHKINIYTECSRKN